MFAYHFRVPSISVKYIHNFVKQSSYSQLTVFGVHGVHGEPAQHPVVAALKKEAGHSNNQHSAMALIVYEVTWRLGRATLINASMVCHVGW